MLTGSGGGQGEPGVVGSGVSEQDKPLIDRIVIKDMIEAVLERLISDPREDKGINF